jgi:hypothetical protein
MSRAFFRKPEFRLYFGYPIISLTRAPAQEPLASATFGQPSFPDDFRGLGDEVARAGGRLTVVLPEAEVWRGRLALAARTPFGRWREARAAVAARLALAPGAVAVVLGPLGPGGTPVAAVRRETIDETRAFLAVAGLRPAAFAGAGAFPGFDTPPILGPRLPPLGLRLPPWPRAAAAALAGAVAVTALLGLAPPAPQPSAPTAPVAVAAPEPHAPPPVDLAAVTPRPRPAAHLAEVAAPEARLPASPSPVATLASRNLPLLGLERARDLPEGLRLAELTTARARLTDALIATPLRRPAPAAAAAEAAAAPAASGPRPLHRPTAASAAPSAPAAPAPVAEGRPRPRPAEAAGAALADAISRAVKAAPAEPLRVAAPDPGAPDATPPARRPAAAPALAGAISQAVKAAAAQPVRVAALDPGALGAPSPARRPAATKAAAPPPAATVRKVVAPAPKPVAARPPAPKVVAVQPARTPAPARQPQQVRQAAAPAVAAAPRQQVRAGRGNLALIGVFGASGDRHALVRLPGGDVRRVRPGDSVQGAQVAAVGSDSIRLRGGGRETVLTLPD